MKTTKTILTFFLASLAGVAACSKHESPSKTETTGATIGASWQTVTKEWPEDAKSAVRQMTQKYGAPDEVTATRLTWYERGPWKRSEVSRDPVRHEWPTLHFDVLEQFVDYHVPPDKVDELASFDGSVMVERTKGELSARCAGEEANFLAVNVARELAEGKRSVEDARKFYEVTLKAQKEGANSEYTTRLRSDFPKGAGDPDRKP